MFVLDCEQIIKLEHSAVDNGDTFLRLMQNAGESVFEFIKKNLAYYLDKIVIIAGKGNNGGDGFVVAEKLYDEGFDVSIVLVCGNPATDISKFYFNRIKNKDIKIIEYQYKDERSLKQVVDLINSAALIVDAIFGIGFRGIVRESCAELFKVINEASAKVLSIDLPSGLSCDNLPIQGIVIKADYTVTFSAFKPANVLYPSSDYCGKVSVESVGISDDLLYQSENLMTVIDKNVLNNILKPRILSSNKGSFGRLLCVCGKEGMAGAAILSAKAAVKSGVGLVESAVVRNIYPIAASHMLEPVFTLLNGNEFGTISRDNINIILQRLHFAKACLIGCGIGNNQDTQLLVKSIIKSSDIPLIIDADAINAIAGDVQVLKEAKSDIVLTPHPGEMSRLINKPVNDIQENRINEAKNFAKEYHVFLVLKGSNTLVATPDGKVFVNITGNPGMAKGGSGDVLSGIISSFIAQSGNIQDSILSGVFVHGLVGDICAKKYSQTSMTPSDMIKELSTFFLDYEKIFII